MRDFARVFRPCLTRWFIFLKVADCSSQLLAILVDYIVFYRLVTSRQLNSTEFTQDMHVKYKKNDFDDEWFTGYLRAILTASDKLRMSLQCWIIGLKVSSTQTFQRFTCSSREPCKVGQVFLSLLFSPLPAQPIVINHRLLSLVFVVRQK